MPDRPACGELSRAWPDQRFEQSITDAITLGSSLREISQTTAQLASSRVFLRLTDAVEKGLRNGLNDDSC
jgi:hypothetical protein